MLVAVVEMILGLILYHISIQYHGSPPPPLPPKGKIVPILDQCQKYFQTLTLILTLSLAYLTGAKMCHIECTHMRKSYHIWSLTTRAIVSNQTLVYKPLLALAPRPLLSLTVIYLSLHAASDLKLEAERTWDKSICLCSRAILQSVCVFGCSSELF